MRVLLPALAVLVALVAAVPAAAASGSADRGPTARASGCITTLPIGYAFGSRYAAHYRGERRIRISVRSHGRRIRKLKAEIYTFGGALVAQGHLGGSLRGRRHINMRLRYGRGIQQGQYTLVLTGEPNPSPSCGPKKFIKVIEFRGCPTSGIGVTFPNPPSGEAREHGRRLYIPVSANGGFYRRVRLRLLGPNGALLATERVGALYNTYLWEVATSDLLRPGTYRVIADRAETGMPAHCTPPQTMGTFALR